MLKINIIYGSALLLLSTFDIKYINTIYQQN